jgi:hypothetical protein
VVSVSPADTAVTVGDVFHVRVVTTAVSDLKGFHLLHRFDSDRLRLEAVTAGNVLTLPGGAYVLETVPDTAPADTTLADGAMLDGTSSGPGVLVTLRFRALAEGDSPVECLESDLRDSFNAQTLPDCASGMVHVLGPVSTRRSSWGRLKLHHR